MVNEKKNEIMQFKQKIKEDKIVFTQEPSKATELELRTAKNATKFVYTES